MTDLFHCSLVRLAHDEVCKEPSKERAENCGQGRQRAAHCSTDVCAENRTPVAREAAACVFTGVTSELSACDLASAPAINVDAGQHETNDEIRNEVSACSSPHGVGA